MRHFIWPILVLGLCASQAVRAKDFDWVSTHEQMSALSSLASGYAAGLRCDRLVNTSVASHVLDRAFPKLHFSSRQAADFAKMVTGIVAMDAAMLGPANDSYCREIRRAFGPNGSQIPGLLD